MEREMLGLYVRTSVDDSKKAIAKFTLLTVALLAGILKKLRSLPGLLLLPGRLFPSQLEMICVS
jgi:hypothetical protein